MNIARTKEILEQLVRIHEEKSLLDEELKDVKEVDWYYVIRRLYAL